MDLIKVGSALFALFFLSRCGQVCVGPFGATDVCYTPVTTSASGTCSSASGLCIAVTPTNYQSGQVPRNVPLTLTAQNGTATYTWSKIPVTGTAGELTGTTAGVTAGTFTGGTATYTPPASASGTTKIQLMDSTTRTYTLTFDTP
jgi:hypothetical protein